MLRCVSLPNLQTLTCYRSVRIDHHPQVDVENMNKKNEVNGINIKTLRLLKFSSFFCPPNILSEQSAIESMNFHKSVQNLTLYHNTTHGLKEDWIECLENLFRKDHYYNLKNVNILLESLWHESMEKNKRIRG